MSLGTETKTRTGLLRDRSSVPNRSIGFTLLHRLQNVLEFHPHPLPMSNRGSFLVDEEAGIRSLSATFRAEVKNSFTPTYLLIA